MKAAPFRYIRPDSIEAVTKALSDEPDAKVIAGGQSLVPMMAMRLARPALLVDLGTVPGLDEMNVDGDWLRVGAMVRQRQLERSAAAPRVPLVSAALPYVGHRELRNRGTICGSLAHADPSAELPAVAVTLGAVLEIRGATGTRTVPAAQFFTGPLQTVLAPAEVVVAARFPVAKPGEGYGFNEIARRHGDFALAGACARIRRESGRVSHAAVGLFGVGETPVSVDLTERFSGETGAGTPSHDVLADAGRAVAADLNPSDDVHASADYRLRLAAVVVARALEQAFDSATREQRS